MALKDHSQEWLCYLLLEEILEGLSGVVVARWGRCRRRGGSLLCVGGGGGVLLDSGAELVEFAVVANVLGSDAFGDGLRALELRGGVEEPALFATVKLKAALGTFAVGIEAGI